MILPVIILGLAAVIGIIGGMIARDQLREEQVIHSLWMTPVGMLVLAFIVSIIAEPLVSAPFGGRTLMLLIGLEAGALGYMIGTVLGLMGFRFEV